MLFDVSKMRNKIESRKMPIDERIAIRFRCSSSISYRIELYLAFLAAQSPRGSNDVNTSPNCSVDCPTIRRLI